MEDIDVTYYEGLPSQSFFASIPKRSVVVIDDQYEESINAPQIAKAFKRDRRHNEFSIILITQSIFETGKYSKCIRNNSQILVLFKNYGDCTTNLRLASQLGLRKRFQECLRDVETVSHGYVVINNSSKNEHDELRVSFNIFGEFKKFGPFPIFYVDD